MSFSHKFSYRWRERFFRYAPLFVWLGVIAWLSSDSGSMSETSRFVRPVLRFLFPDASEETILTLHGLVRKSAHVFVYSVLAFLAARAFLKTSVAGIRSHWAAAAIGIVFLVASLDELNQSFSGGTRTGSIWDVALDTVSGAAAIGAIYLLLNRPFVRKLLGTG
ncbi:MAG: VanZ family protein [Acidobacteria bacterium]|nr:VanZ family protein [Acidobacteriota bacterium]